MPVRVKASKIDLLVVGVTAGAAVWWTLLPHPTLSTPIPETPPAAQAGTSDDYLVLFCRYVGVSCKKESCSNLRTFCARVVAVCPDVGCHQ